MEYFFVLIAQVIIKDLVPETVLFDRSLWIIGNKLYINSRNPLQLKLMKVGGNRNLRNFLNSHEIPSDLDKKTVYLSNIMQYYRKMVYQLMIIV